MLSRQFCPVGSQAQSVAAAAAAAAYLAPKSSTCRAATFDAAVGCCSIVWAAACKLSGDDDGGFVRRPCFSISRGQLSLRVGQKTVCLSRAFDQCGSHRQLRPPCALSALGGAAGCLAGWLVGNQRAKLAWRNEHESSRALVAATSLAFFLCAQLLSLFGSNEQESRRASELANE